jgi:ribonuclease Z
MVTHSQQLDPPASSPLYLVADYNVHLYLREVSDIENLGIDDPSKNGVVSIISWVIYITPRNFVDGDDWAEPVR